ncbi:MAG: type II toxin-antitoxin system VapC family toxin [Vulcanimicrobiaceae bacterium]
MIARAADVTYWETSAILSALFRDANSDAATARARSAGLHLLSSLAWNETQAVMARIEREKAASAALVESAREVLEMGPWRRVNVSPDWQIARELSRKWPLRGADLWHLCAAKALHAELPELRLLSFDTRLAVSAQGEGLA